MIPRQWRNGAAGVAERGPSCVLFVATALGLLGGACAGGKEQRYSGPLAELAASALARIPPPSCDTTAITPAPGEAGPFVRCQTRLDSANVSVIAGLGGRVVEVAYEFRGPPLRLRRIADSVTAAFGHGFGAAGPWCDGPLQAERLQWQAGSFYAVLVVDTLARSLLVSRTVGVPYCK